MAHDIEQEGQYKVLWSRPAHSKQELEAGRFSAKSEEDAWGIFEKDYGNNQRFGGDKLVLVCIVQPEITRVVGWREDSPEDDY